MNSIVSRIHPHRVCDGTTVNTSVGSDTSVYLTVNRRRKISLYRINAQKGDDDKQEMDFVEGFVAKIFGKKALNDRTPAGLKRLDNPEMYPAVIDEWANPVEGDTPEIAIIRPLLAKTQLEKAPLRLAYDASRDGWTAVAFHERVNTFGAAIVVMETEGGAVIGGYNPRGFIGLGEERDSMSAFLFTWPEGTSGTKTQKVFKLPKIGGPSLAVVDKPESGVSFGAEGLKFLVPGKDPKECRCRLGTYYAKLPDGKRTLFSKDEDEKITKLKNIKCFVREGRGEEWILDGIVWKTSVQNE